MKDGELLKQMGAKIKALRTENKMTLQKLADLTGLELSGIWFLESGQRNPHVLTLKKIADVFGIDVKDFL